MNRRIIELRTKLCGRKRFVNRRVTRYLLTAILVVMAINSAFNIVSYFDRSRLNGLAESRGIIQALAIRARRENRLLTPQEEKVVADLWEVSGYSGAIRDAENIIEQSNDK